MYRRFVKFRFEQVEELMKRIIGFVTMIFAKLHYTLLLLP